MNTSHTDQVARVGVAGRHDTVVKGKDSSCITSTCTNHEPTRNMASTPLVALAGNAVTTWDSLNDTVEPFTFCPHGNFPVNDVAWNHNGQGMSDI